MKTWLRVSICFFLLSLLFSCSNGQAVKEPHGLLGEPTLRSTLLSLSDSVPWTQELEPDVVSERKTGDIKRFGAPRMSVPAAASALSALPEELVFPQIDGLGSLDMAVAAADVVALVEDFCNGLVNKKEPYSLMLAGREYILTIFLYDVSKVDFTGFVMASPYEDGLYTQVPVRLYSGNSFLDVQLYVVNTGSLRRIDQIKYGEIVHE